MRCPNANDEQCRYPDCTCHLALSQQVINEQNRIVDEIIDEILEEERKELDKP